MEKYYYTKAGIDPEVLTEAILLRTTLRSSFLSCKITEKESMGTVVDDNICLSFSRALISSEQDEITNLINTIDMNYDLMVRKGIENNTMAWAMKQGMTLMAQMGANNLYLGKTHAQTEALTTQYPDLIHSMLTGSLTITYSIFSNMVSDENISQPEITEFKLRLERILGIS